MADENPDWIAEFIACLDVVDGRDLRIEESFIIKNAHLPARLYKFRGVSDFSLDNLANGTVWVNSPSKYNDPYDSAGSISIEEVIASIQADNFDALVARQEVKEALSDNQIAEARSAEKPYRELNRMMIESEPSIPKADVPKVLDELEKSMVEILRPGLEGLIENLRNGMKICSFCATKEPITMWTHYADHHKGFCMEYDVSKTNEFSQRMLFPVIYSKDMFNATKYVLEAIKGSKHFNNIFGALQILYKSTEWAYEQEWRLAYIAGMIRKEENTPFALPDNVYLGARISEEDREKVLDVCRKKGIAAYQMSLIPNRFELRSESIAL